MTDSTPPQATDQINTNKTRAMATRLTISQLAKARDGLIAKGIDSQDLLSVSQILRLSVFLAITSSDNPETLPSDASLSILTNN